MKTLRPDEVLRKMVERVRPAEIVRRVKQRGTRFPRGRLGASLPDVRSAGLARFFISNLPLSVSCTAVVSDRRDVRQASGRTERRRNRSSCDLKPGKLRYLFGNCSGFAPLALGWFSLDRTKDPDMLVTPSRFCVCGVVSALTLIACSATLVAASDDARRAYGYGIHLLYQGRLMEAVQSFDLAAAEWEDPRIYYFRGIAKRRLGQSEEAQIDFLIGAQLEATTGRQDVGRALERIQGGDRLVIERYRRDARRLVKSGLLTSAPRVVQAEPRAVQAEPLPQPHSKPDVRKLAVSEVPTNLPPDERDPFTSSAAGLLGRGVIEKAAHTTAEPAPSNVVNDSDEQPLGTGFDEGTLANDDPFPAELSDDSEWTDGGQAPKKRGVLGSVLRAVTKSALPASPEQGKNLLDGIRGSLPLPGGPPAGGPAQTGGGFPDQGAAQSGGPPTGDQDPFAEPFTDEPADDDTNSDPFTIPADDPFDEGSDPFGNGDDDSATSNDAVDPFSDAADPFADETDPFGDDQ
jgi:hypothetical protein